MLSQKLKLNSGQG